MVFCLFMEKSCFLRGVFRNLKAPTEMIFSNVCFSLCRKDLFMIFQAVPFAHRTHAILVQENDISVCRTHAMFQDTLFIFFSSTHCFSRKPYIFIEHFEFFQSPNKNFPELSLPSERYFPRRYLPSNRHSATRSLWLLSKIRFII